jgi:formate dehydrogenase subunit delta
MDIAPLVRMANQIARNLAAQGESRAIDQTARHIRDFWDPRMIAALLAAPAPELDPLAAAAVERLRG